MILAEKIMSLRKQKGWSQEELAEQLEVSRQSVSKWESAASIPDIEKIIKMSQLFGVSTDYLLKDNEEIEPNTDTASIASEEQPPKGRTISLEFANDYMDLIKGSSKKVAFAVSMCIISPVLVMLLAVMSEDPGFNVTENFAVGVGLVYLFVLVAIAVLIFIMEGMKLSKYEFLEKEPISLMYGVEAVVARKEEAFDPTFRLSIAIGVVTCILSAVPIAVAGAAGASDLICVIMVCLLLVMVSIAVFLFVSTGMVKSSYTKLLQEEEFTIEEKSKAKKNEAFYGVYWSLVTAGYLAWSFITFRWDSTWIVWPVAGVLFVPYKLLIDNLRK